MAGLTKAIRCACTDDKCPAKVRLSWGDWGVVLLHLTDVNGDNHHMVFSKETLQTFICELKNFLLNQKRIKYFAVFARSRKHIFRNSVREKQKKRKRNSKTTLGIRSKKMTKDDLKDEVREIVLEGFNGAYILKDKAIKKLHRLIDDNMPDPQPLVTGLDWEEIEEELDKRYVDDDDVWKHRAHDRYALLANIMSILKQQKRWVVVPCTNLGMCCGYKLFDSHKIEMTTDWFPNIHRGKEQAQAECDQLNEEEGEEKPLNPVYRMRNTKNTKKDKWVIYEEREVVNAIYGVDQEPFTVNIATVYCKANAEKILAALNKKEGEWDR